ELGSSTHAVSQIQQELQMHSQCHVLPLTTLSQDETRHYIACRFPQPLFSDSLLVPLHQRCNGNPLFMVCLLDELTRAGTIDESTIIGMVPDTLQRMFEHQAAQLAKSDQEVVAAAAVEGEVFSTASVAAVLDRDPLDVESTCEGLVGRQIFLKRADPVRLPDG